jgi:GNAT superfamily N-acetyltransferase/ribosomal protein S27AE
MTVDVRPASREDAGSIRAVAETSLQTSYSLSPVEIETILERVFGEEVLTDRLKTGDGAMFVAECPDESDEPVVAGMAEIDADSTLRWLHVDPEFRGRGVGTALFERARAEATRRNEPPTARVLQAAAEGGGFLEQFGLEQAGTDVLAFDAEEFPEHVYTVTGSGSAPNEPAVEVPSTVSVEGTEATLDRDDPVPGTEAPFFALFGQTDDDRRYGFFCSNCGRHDVAGDGLDRLECEHCGNVHRADSWDDAYL